MPTVDVDWDGVSLAKGATAREQDGGWFVELEQPMPVGTSLHLSGEVQASLTVARVHEGVGAGMLLKTASSRPSAAVSAEKTVDSRQSTVDSAEEAAKAGGDKSDGGDKTDGGGDKTDGGGGGEKKEKRRRKR